MVKLVLKFTIKFCILIFEWNKCNDNKKSTYKRC